MTRLYRATPEQRFWQYVDKSAGPDACWPWTASRNRKGYGQLWTPDAGMVPAHRFSLQLKLSRPVGAEMFACHMCDNPPCVNPAHLYEGTCLDNARDMVDRGRHARAGADACMAGHPWTEESTRWREKDGRTYRSCRICAVLQPNRQPTERKPLSATCRRGHLRTEENTRIRVDKRGYVERHCRTCAAERRAAD